jgi:tRNA1(Val) A37 N6-methylase TrmN6
MADQFFTPSDIASKLIASFRRRQEAVIADFAAGDGVLLTAAEKRWPKATFIATDIMDATVRRLRCNHQEWNVGKCDFLDKRSRERCAALKDISGHVTLAILNPPFSCRGGERIELIFQGEKVSCSRAMAFVLTATSFLAKNGRLAALLPASCLTSQKDSTAWQLARRHFSIITSTSFGPRTFPDCSARTVIVSFKNASRASRGRLSISKTTSRATKIPVGIVRGATPIHAALNGLAGSKWSLVHTTNLQESRVTGERLWLKNLRRHVSGPAILLPRVGKPDEAKCVLYLQNQRIVLSDCVFAITCRSRADAEQLHGRLKTSWNKVVERAWSGTCAPYATLESLKHVLVQVGCEVCLSRSQESILAARATVFENARN